MPVRHCLPVFAGKGFFSSFLSCTPLFFSFLTFTECFCPGKSLFLRHLLPLAKLPLHADQRDLSLNMYVFQYVICLCRLRHGRCNTNSQLVDSTSEIGNRKSLDVNKKTNDLLQGGDSSKGRVRTPPREKNPVEKRGLFLTVLRSFLFVLSRSSPISCPAAGTGPSPSPYPWPEPFICS
jgi:hypothetical protein